MRTLFKSYCYILYERSDDSDRQRVYIWTIPHCMHLYRWTRRTGGADGRTSFWKRLLRCSIIWCIVCLYGKRWKNLETASYPWRLAGNNSTIERYHVSGVFLNYFREAVEVSFNFDFFLLWIFWKKKVSRETCRNNMSMHSLSEHYRWMFWFSIGYQTNSSWYRCTLDVVWKQKNLCKVLSQGKVRNAHAMLERVESDLDHYSVNRSGAVQFPLELTNTEWRIHRCSVFTVEPLHLLRSGISKTLKECTVSFLFGTERMMLSTFESMKRRKTSS